MNFRIKVEHGIMPSKEQDSDLNITYRMNEYCVYRVSVYKDGVLYSVDEYYHKSYDEAYESLLVDKAVHDIKLEYKPEEIVREDVLYVRNRS